MSSPTPEMAETLGQQGKGGEKGRNWKRPFLRAVVVLVILAIGLASGLSIRQQDDEPGASELMECPIREFVAPSGDFPAPAVLVPEQPEGLMMPFGRGRGLKEKPFFLKLSSEGILPETGTVLLVKERPLEREEVEGEIRTADFDTSAIVTGRKEVTVTVCIDPSRASLDPGTYTGGIRIEDRRTEDLTVPLTVTVQYRGYVWMISAFGLLVVGAGSLFVWASGRRTAGLDVLGTGWRGHLKTWIASNVLGIVLGVVALGSAFLATYWRNPTWGAKAPEDWLTLLGAMFSAFTAALAASSATASRPPAPPAGGA